MIRVGKTEAEVITVAGMSWLCDVYRRERAGG